MSNFAYTQEQNLIISSDKSLINVGYDYNDMALDTLALLAFESFKSGKKTLLYVPKKQDRDFLKLAFESMNLDALALFVEIKSDISHLKSAFGSRSLSEKFSFDFVSFHIHKLNFQQHYRQTKDAAHQKFFEVSSHHTWREMLDKYVQLPPHSHTLFLHNLLTKYNTNNQDLEQSLEVIRWASSLYNKTYEFVSMDYSNMGIKSLRVDEIHIDDTLCAIKDILGAAQKLNLQYHSSQKNIIEHLNKLDKNWHSAQVKILDKIESLYWVYQDIVKNEKKDNFLTSLFGNKEESQSQKFRQTIQSYLDQLITNLKNKDFEWTTQPKDLFAHLEQDVLSIRQFLNTFSTQFSQKNHDYIRHINRFNFVYPQLQELENQLLDLFDTINTKDIFKTQLEANSISFVKQMDSLESLMIQLEKTISGLEKNISYLKWHSFVRELDEYHHSLIQSLLRIPKEEWERAYLSYNYFSLLHQHRWDPMQDELWDSFDTYKKLSVQYHINDYLAKEGFHSEKLKKENQNLYNYLYKNKPLSEASSWKYLLRKHAQNISDFFPIIVIDNEDIDDIPSNTFDMLAVFDAPNVHPNILQLCPKLITFWGNFDAALMDYRLSTASKIDTEINEVPVSQRFVLCQSLTSLLASLHQWPQVFTLRNTCILSYASPYIESQIVKALYHSGIKSMSMEDNPTELLESVLIDSTENVVVIMEDGFFVSNDLCPIIEQEFIKKNIAKAGFIVLDVSSLQLFEKSDQTIEALKLTLFQYLQNN